MSDERGLGPLRQRLVALWPIFRLFLLILLVGVVILVGLPAVLATAAAPA